MWGKYYIFTTSVWLKRILCIYTTSVWGKHYVNFCQSIHTTSVCRGKQYKYTTSVWGKYYVSFRQRWITKLWKYWVSFCQSIYIQHLCEENSMLQAKLYSCQKWTTKGQHPNLWICVKGKYTQESKQHLTLVKSKQPKFQGKAYLSTSIRGKYSRKSKQDRKVVKKKARL